MMKIFAYFLIGINSSLPVDSHVKMIDAWFMHGLLMPFVVFLLLVMSGWVGSTQQLDKKSTRAAVFLKHCRRGVPIVSTSFIAIFYFVSTTYGR